MAEKAGGVVCVCVCFFTEKKPRKRKFENFNVDKKLMEEKMKIKNNREKSVGNDRKEKVKG